MKPLLFDINEIDWTQLRKDIAKVLAHPYAFVFGLVSLAIYSVLLYRASNPSKPAPEAGTKVTAGGAAKRELRDYTRAEVKPHSKEDDLWLIIKSKAGDGRYKVYDVTKYIEHHPGGDAIFAHAGDDCTEGFNGIQHPPTVYDLVEEYHIGWVSDM